MDVRYRSGRWVAVAAPGAWLLIDGDPAAPLVARCWDLLRAGADELEVLGAIIAANGLRTTGSFAIARYADGAGHLLGRGDVEVRLVDVDGTDRTVAAGEVATWLEQRLGGSLAALTILAPGATGPALPIESAVVPASELRISVAEVRAAPVETARPGADPDPGEVGPASPNSAAPAAGSPVAAATVAVPEPEGGELPKPAGVLAGSPPLAPVPVVEEVVSAISAALATYREDDPEPGVEPAGPVREPAAPEPATPEPAGPATAAPGPESPEPESTEPEVAESAPPEPEPPNPTPDPAPAPEQVAGPGWAPPAVARVPAEDAGATSMLVRDHLGAPAAQDPGATAVFTPGSTGVITHLAWAAPPDPDLTVVRARRGEAADPLVVRAVRCPSGHWNPPPALVCRVCGGGVPEQQPVAVTRPALGALRLSTGDSVPLDRGVLLGRAPDVGLVAGALRAHAVKLQSPEGDISRSHVEVRLRGWQVLVVDLGSRNGTVVTPPADPPFDLVARQPVEIVPGTAVSLTADTSFTYEVTA